MELVAVVFGLLVPAGMFLLSGRRRGDPRGPFPLLLGGYYFGFFCAFIARGMIVR